MRKPKKKSKEMVKNVRRQDNVISNKRSVQKLGRKSVATMTGMVVSHLNIRKSDVNVSHRKDVKKIRIQDMTAEA
jgi:hypothetical protein